MPPIGRGLHPLFFKPDIVVKFLQRIENEQADDRGIEIDVGRHTRPDELKFPGNQPQRAKQHDQHFEDLSLYALAHHAVDLLLQMRGFTAPAHCPASPYRPDDKIGSIKRCRRALQEGGW